MKTFIIYNSVSVRSVKIANESYASFQKYNGWQPELYDGCVPGLLDYYDKKYGLPEEKNKKFNGTPLYPHKKSCFYSHYSLWIKCIEMNEDIAIVEHDTECVGDFPSEYPADGVTQLSTESMLGKNPPYTSKHFEEQYKEKGEGCHQIWYQHPHGHYGLAGCTGYIMTSHAASVYKKICEQDGWYQNDLLISEDHTRMWYFNPSPVRWCKEKELRSSSQGVQL